MEKLFAQRRTAAVSLRELKTLNDSGDIIKVSYNSKVNENCDYSKDNNNRNKLEPSWAKLSSDGVKKLH